MSENSGLDSRKDYPGIYFKINDILDIFHINLHKNLLKYTIYE